MWRSYLLSLVAALMVAATLPLRPYETHLCLSQQLDKTFERCADLPHLGATLHYTYNADNASISIAFIAKPAKPAGWVAWGINPTSVGMLGTQAFIGYVEGDSVAAYTYNVSGYTPLLVYKAPLSFDTWDLSAQRHGSSGEILIYGSAKVPADSGRYLLIAWEVGPMVTDGVLAVHAFEKENLKALGTIELI